MLGFIKQHKMLFQSATLLIVRLIVATIFLFAGYAKWFFWSAPPAGISTPLVVLFKFLSIVEPLGALALILGILTRWAATGLAIIMVGAIVVLHFTMQTPFFTSPQGLGWDYNLIILGNCLILVVFGGGSWSMDKQTEIIRYLSIWLARKK